MSIAEDILEIGISGKELLASLNCPSSYYAPPKITEIEKIPGHIRQSLEPLWNRSIRAGRPVKIAHLKNVFIADEGLVFDENDNLISETREGFTKEAIDFALGQVRILKNTSGMKEIPKAIIAKSRGASNYGHFIVEMLPKAWMARKYLKLHDWPALVFEAPPIVANSCAQALRAAGFSNERIITTDHKPIFVKEIILVSGLASHTQYLSPYVLQSLDEITENIHSDGPSKIYAARGENSSRDFENEPVVAAHLETFGYTNKLSGSLDFVEQVNIFKGAKSVVGVTGAALTNIIFCAPGTEVLNFSPSGAAEVLFWMISQARRLDYHEIRCPEIGPQKGGLPWDRDIKVTGKDLNMILENRLIDA